MRSRNTRIRTTASWSTTLSGGAACAALSCGLAFGAQDAANPDGVEQAPLERLSDRLDTLERDNAFLRDEVEILRAQTRQEWLTEERTTQLRALVSDVLSDSSTRTSLQDAAATAGWDADRGFYLRSADNRFMLQVSGLLQARYIWSHASGAGYANNYGSPYLNTFAGGSASRLPNNNYGFDLPHTQLVFKGHVFEPGIRFFLRTEFKQVGTFQSDTFASGELSNGTLNLLDAYAAFDFDNEWSVRIGQFKLPFSRERLVSVQNLLTADRSSVDMLMGLDRSQGIELSLQGSNLSWAFAFSDGGTDNLLAGVSNNSGYFPVGTEPLNSPYWYQQATFAFTSRLEYKIAGDWAEFQEMTSPIGEANGILLGVAGHYQMGGQPSDLQPNGDASIYTGGGLNQWLNITADLSMNFGGATIYGAVYYSNSETKWALRSGTPAAPTQSVSGTTNLLGILLQGSMYVAPKWELFARYQYVDTITAPSTQAFNGTPAVEFSPLNIATIGANWYIDGQDLRWNFQIGYAFNEVTQVSATPGTGFRPLFNSTNELVLMTQLQLQF